MENKTLEIVYRKQSLQIEYFLRRGQKETILYLQGLGCSKNDFAGAANARDLQPYTFVAFDFPGCGNSPYSENVTLGIDDLVEITNIVISELDLTDLVIIGHSMGGLVALLYTEKYPNHIKGFINIEGNLASEDCFFSRRIAENGSAGFTRDALNSLQQKLAQSKSKGIREYARSLQSASARACVDYALPLVDYSDNGNLIQRFTGLKTPKLFVYGSENCGLSYIPELKSSGCEVVEIPDSGHFPFHDNPSAYYQIIYDFLNHGLPGKSANSK